MIIKNYWRNDYGKKLKDAVIYETAFGVTIGYPTKTPYLMNEDNRQITDQEIIGMFENYLRRFCEENNNDTLEITNDSGKKLFEAKLLDFKTD